MRFFILLLSLTCCACVNHSLQIKELTCNDRQDIDTDLSSCDDDYNTDRASLSTIMPQIKEGMSLTEANTLLSRRKPYLRYRLPSNNNTIWEFDERDNLSDNAISHSRLLINVDTQEKITTIMSSQCLLPDSVLHYKLSSASNCYERQFYPFKSATVYDAVKQLLITSNYYIDHSDAASLIISAAGLQSIDEDSDKVMFIKLTAIFKDKPNGTEVIISASFNVSEKQSVWVQAGFAGVTLPIPLPFQEKSEWIYTGIVTPRFYLNFYDTLSALIASEFLSYKEAKKSAATLPKTVVSDNKTSILPVETKSVIDNKAVDINTATVLPQTRSLLPKFEGALDNDSNLQKLYQQEAINNEQPRYYSSPLNERVLPDVFDLHGQALDSEQILRVKKQHW
ncbi:MAG: hypothetical protein WAX77_15490 [Methylococcaceae bacterium]